MNKWLVIPAILLSGVVQAQTVEEVGDPDSFGRDVTYLGLAGVDPVHINSATNCPLIVAEGGVCVVSVPGQNSEFASSAVDSIQLPARASNSMLCFAVTPNLARRFSNTTTSSQTGNLLTRALLTVESSVLQDLVDPNTGLPFDGKIEFTFITNSETRRLVPGDFDSSFLQLSRSCQGALISKRALIQTYGLTQTQANNFFNRAITVRIGSSGVGRFVETMTYSVGLRLYGDRR